MARITRVLRVPAVWIACVFLASETVDAQASYCSVERVSVATGGTEGNGESREPTFSADSRYVAFTSMASLVPGDLNGVLDVFVRDRLSAQTEIVSVSTSGVQGNSDSNVPSISADGRYVAFVSWSSNLVPGDVNNFSDAFVRDRMLGTTTLASLAPGGFQLNGYVTSTRLSSDATLILFETSATNLGFIDTNGDQDIFVRVLQTGQVELISIALNGHAGLEGGSNGNFSGDGRLVVFESNATDIIPNKTNNGSDIFIRDRWAATTVRVSTTPAGGEANGDSYGGAISANGQYVSFQTYATNLVAGTNPSVSCVVRKDLATGATLHASEGQGGAMPDDESYASMIDGDGRLVAFASLATNLVGGDTNVGGDVFVRDCTTGVLERWSLTSTGGQSGSMAYPLEMAIALDGSAVAWSDYADDLVTGDTNGFGDVFVRDCTRNYSLFCQGKQNSQGCMPALLASGNTSASSAAPFVISASRLINNKPGLFIYGLGPDASPFQGGTLCVQLPIVRLAATSTGGSPPPNDCSGALAVDFKSVIQSGSNPALVAGQIVCVQGYHRDGQSSPFGCGLTPAVEFEIEP